MKTSTKVLFASFYLISLLTTSTSVSAQDNTSIDVHSKGSMFAFWGWNRALFKTSDIHFTGENYDFTLQDVRATDRPSAITLDKYFNPANITLPQTNFKFGYFFADNYSISFGVDHMKYIMTNNQAVKIDGEINVGSEFDGVYDNDIIDLEQEGFLLFEHSDGLNFINFEVSKYDHLVQFDTNLSLSMLTGLGLGIMLPRTNATLLGNERHDAFHVAGWGATLKNGLELNYHSFFTRLEVKVGYSDMPDIRTTANSSDKAQQEISFTEFDIVFGYYF